MIQWLAMREAITAIVTWCAGRFLGLLWWGREVRVSVDVLTYERASGQMGSVIPMTRRDGDSSGTDR